MDKIDIIAPGDSGPVGGGKINASFIEVVKVLFGEEIWNGTVTNDILAKLQNLSTNNKTSFLAAINEANAKASLIDDTQASSAVKTYSINKILELLLLNETWISTPNGNLTTKNSTKVAINKQEAEFALDVGQQSSLTQLTGSYTLNWGQITCTGAVLSDELSAGSVITVISTGLTFTIEFIDENYNEAYIVNAMESSDSFTNEALQVVSIDPKLANIGDVFKVLKSGNGENTLELPTNLKSTVNDVVIDSQYYSHGLNNENISAPDGNSFYKNFSFPAGYPKISFAIVKQNGKYIASVQGRSHLKKIKIDEDGSIYFEGLPSSAPSGSNQIYKDINGFLKIG